MATLRTFQTEIDDIHNREVAKQRAKATVIAEKEKEVKEQKLTTSTTAHAKGKAKDNDSSSTTTKPAECVVPIRASLLELEDRILV
jgi:hypothetical protein